MQHRVQRFLPSSAAVEWFIHTLGAFCKSSFPQPQNPFAVGFESLTRVTASYFLALGTTQIP